MEKRRDKLLKNILSIEGEKMVHGKIEKTRWIY